MRKVLLLVLCIFWGASLFAQAPLKRPTKAKPQKAQVAKSKPQSQPAKPKPYKDGTVNGHDYVDLGLPSGVKWATCNVGANSPEDYGDYFAWGETSPKETYNWSHYKWGVTLEEAVTKYCTKDSNGAVDYKTTLEPADDVASVLWGRPWSMPTYPEYEELRECCTWEWTTQNGIEGYKVTGPNGHYIFLPAAGHRSYSLVFVSEQGGYWSSSLYESYPLTAYGLFFDLDSNKIASSRLREYGYSVRAVVL